MSTPRGNNIAQVGKDYVQRLVVADNATEPVVLTCIPFLIADAATGDVDLVLQTKFEVMDVTCIKRNGAGAGNTMQVKNGATTISDAIACATDGAITRASNITAANSVVAAGGTLRVTATRAAGTRNATVLVYGFVRA